MVYSSAGIEDVEEVLEEEKHSFFIRRKRCEMEDNAVQDDPTGEYQRHQRRLRSIRRSDFGHGITNFVAAGGSFVFALYIFGFLLWTHDTRWYVYLFGCLFLVYAYVFYRSGRRGVRSGRRPVIDEEVMQAKQQHRQRLQEEVKGNLPSDYSKGTRIFAIVIALFFASLAGVYWYLYFAHPSQAGDFIGYALGHTVAALVALLYALNTFMGKKRQQQSAAELRSILQAGEFNGSPGEETQTK